MAQGVGRSPGHSLLGTRHGHHSVGQEGLELNSEVGSKLGVEEGGWRERRTDRETERQMEAERAAARTQTDRHTGKSDREVEEDVCLGPEVPPGLWL